MSSAGVFHAKTFHLQASKQVLNMEHDQDSFMNLCESFAWYDRNTSSWKTYQQSFLTDWTPFLENWPRQGLMLNGHVFRRQMWAPATEGIGGGALPTPRSHRVMAARLEAQQTDKRRNRGKGPNLEEAIAWMLPTPRTCSAMAAWLDTAGNLEGERFPNLETVVAREMLDQPSSLKCLSADINLLPTPLARDHKGSGRDGQLPTVLTPTGEATYLNPSFVEEMMGFPIEWTALKR
jgi:hypothetical protein